MVDMEYRDLMGQDVHEIPLIKNYVKADRVDYNDKKWVKATNLNDIKKEAKEFPGCRLRGEFNSLMKVKAEIHVNFREQQAVYQSLKKDPEMNLNLNFHLQSMFFGDKQSYYNLASYMEKYEPKIRTELNPAMAEKAHDKGNFAVKYNLHVFPVEFKSDFTGTVIDSYQYSMVSKFKPISVDSIDLPDITFQVEFVPFVRVWHLQKLSMRKFAIGILGICGGVYSMLSIVNWFLSTSVKALVSP